MCSSDLELWSISKASAQKIRSKFGVMALGSSKRFGFGNAYWTRAHPFRLLPNIFLKLSFKSFYSLANVFIWSTRIFFEGVISHERSKKITISRPRWPERRSLRRGCRPVPAGHIQKAQLRHHQIVRHNQNGDGDEERQQHTVENCFLIFEVVIHLSLIHI